MRQPHSVRNSRNLEKLYSQKIEYVQMPVRKYYSLDLCLSSKRCAENTFQNKNKNCPDKRTIVKERFIFT